MIMDLVIKKLAKVQTPSKGNSSDACWDLYVPTEPEKHIIVTKGSKATINLGLYVEIPEGYHAEIMLRKKYSKEKGLILPNGLAIIHANRNTEWYVTVYNIGNSNVNIGPGDSFCQFKILKDIEITFIEQ